MHWSSLLMEDPVMVRRLRSPAFTLIELLVVIGILGLLMAVILPAVQYCRASAARASCANNLKQIGLALHSYHDTAQILPPGMSYNPPDEHYPFMSWQARLLPYVEQQGLWDVTVKAYATGIDFREVPPHVGFVTVMPVFACPADGRTLGLGKYGDHVVAFTDYLGVEGINSSRVDGVLFLNSRIRFADVTDGTSQTLAVGERPPSADGIYGWWYGGMGQALDGSTDSVLGVREKCYNGLVACPKGPYEYGLGRWNNNCDMFHFWSNHTGGANFLFVDGAVHFLPYSAQPILSALATRAGGEAVSLPD
jgi:prepilin-type N-terminal cleavage/methylation domain-containing protein/prepilin-type processing-associated H-X9-DG protein